MVIISRLLLSGIMLFGLSLAAKANDVNGKALVNDICAACHQEGEDGGLARISEVRKTPEGWDMTIFRMQHVHGLQVEAEDRFAIIKYLSDQNGLAPSEAAPFRYVLEQRSYFVDKAVTQDLDALCGRCHTNARYGLQRRTEQDWLKHMHFHIGQFPSIEYQARARDRFWWQEVSTTTYKELAKLYPFQASAWQDWKTAQHKSPVGEWRVVGHRPGLGGYQGIMTVTRDGDFYRAIYDLYNFDGKPLKGDSKSVIYTGYEWRGSGVLNNVETREVYALSEQGDQMTGRWYEADHYDIGGEFRAVRMGDAKAQILSRSGDYIRAGNVKEVSLYGVNLTGKVTADKGLSVVLLTQNNETVTLKVTAGKDTAPGPYKVTVGQAATEIIIYDKVDFIRVLPEWTIARLGGGMTPPVTAQFEAVAYMKGQDGIMGSDDDIKIGIMDAHWQAHPFDENADQMKDVDFAGRLSQQGTYYPAKAGPNPERKYATNNAGNLKIIAQVKDGDRVISGEGQLIVTVQRWNLPPIR